MLKNYDFITIDEEDTIEIDDAISIKETVNKIEILIAIADLSEYLPLSLFHLAYNTQNSLYFIYNNFYMLVDKKVIKSFSLIKNTIKPVLIFRVSFSKKLESIGFDDFDFDFRLIEIKENLSYEKADKYNPYQILNKVAKQLISMRLENGATILNIPKIKLDKNFRKIKFIYPLKGYRFIIQELMILANHLSAKIAQKNNIPFIFLHNPTNLENTKKSKIISNPLEIYQTLRTSELSYYSLKNRNHNLVGLQEYAHITSPIRRFIDIINQRQLLSLFYNIDPYYNENELKEFISIANLQNINKNNLYKNYLQSYLKNYFHFNNINTFKGYVIDKKEDYIKIYLSDYFIETEENLNQIKIIKGKLEKNNEIIFQKIKQ